MEGINEFVLQAILLLNTKKEGYTKMKKIFTFTLLILLVTLSSTSSLAFSFDSDTDFEEPQMLLGGCPPGVPCDDQGGGGGTGTTIPAHHTHSVRDEQAINWSPTMTIYDFDASDYSSDDYDNAEENIQAGLWYIPIGDEKAPIDECSDFTGNHLRKSEAQYGNPGNTFDYSSTNETFYYRDQYFEKSITNESHYVYDIYSRCQEFLVTENMASVDNTTDLLHWSRRIDDGLQLLVEDIYLIPSSTYILMLSQVIEDYEDENQVSLLDLGMTISTFPITLLSWFLPIIGPLVSATAMSGSAAYLLNILSQYIVQNSIDTWQQLEADIIASLEFDDYISLNMLSGIAPVTQNLIASTGTYSTNINTLDLLNGTGGDEFFGNMEKVEFDKVYLTQVLSEYITITKAVVFTVLW